MKRFFIIVSSIIFLFSNSCFADELPYTEDNGAYWYMKALDLMPNNYSVSYNFYSEAPHVRFKVKGNNTSFNLDNLEKIVEYLKIARSKKKCIFFVVPKYEDDENTIIEQKDLHKIYNNLSPACTMAIYALSEEKPEFASLIWLSILDISLKIIENNSIHIRSYIGDSTIRDVLYGLSRYFENGASDEFKKTFIDYMRAWPSSVFDLNDIKKVHYDYYMNSLEKYTNNTEILAKLFGYDKNAKKTRIVKNNICTRNIFEMKQEMETFYTILHLYLFGLQRYDNNYLRHYLQATPYFYFIRNEKKISKILDEMYYHQIIKYMLGVIFIFLDNDYICPENGYRKLDIRTTLESHKKYDISYKFISCKYIISCDCKGKEEPIIPDPNKKSIEDAEKYRVSQKFITDEKEYNEYCDNLLNIDFSKELTESDFKLIEIDFNNSNKLLHNLLFSDWQTLSKYSIRRINDAQKRIDEFLNKFASD